MSLRLIKIFEDMQKNISDGSIIIISHQERILSIADEIIVLADGQIKNHGDAKTILPQIVKSESIIKECGKIKEV